MTSNIHPPQMLGGTSLTTTASPRIYYAFIYLIIYLQERLQHFRYTAQGLAIVILEIT